MSCKNLTLNDTLLGKFSTPNPFCIVGGDSSTFKQFTKCCGSEIAHAISGESCYAWCDGASNSIEQCMSESGTTYFLSCESSNVNQGVKNSGPIETNGGQNGSKPGNKGNKDGSKGGKEGGNPGTKGANGKNNNNNAGVSMRSPGWLKGVGAMMLVGFVASGL